MNKYARDLKAIREADASKAILTCHDEYLLASMVQGVDGALVGFASFHSPAHHRSAGMPCKAGDLQKAMAFRPSSRRSRMPSMARVSPQAKPMPA